MKRGRATWGSRDTFLAYTGVLPDATKDTDDGTRDSVSAKNDTEFTQHARKVRSDDVTSGHPTWLTF